MRDWLVSIRKKQSMTQKAICDRLNISQPTYWGYEHGIITPTVQNAKKIGAILGFDWTRFYEEPKERVS